MKKPLAITSPDHAVALSLYFMLGLTGLFGVLNFNRSSSIIEAMGPVVADVWSTTLMIAGFSAFMSALSAKRSRRPEWGLLYEALGCAGLTLNMGWFLAIVSINFGARGFTSASFAMIFLVGCGLRVWQIWREHRLLRKARCNPTVSDDQLLADPREEHDLA